MRRFTRAVLATAVFGTFVTSSLPAMSDWQLLGTRKVSLARETDVLDVSRQGRFDALRIEVENGPLEMYSIQVVFSNGERFSPATRLDFRDGDATRVIDLPGTARTIQRIVFRYRGPARLGAATVRVYGREAGGGRDDAGRRNGGVRSPSADGWTQLGARQVDFGSDHDAIQAEGSRRFNSILIAVEGADVEISNISVNFANGEHFDPDVRLVFEENSRSRFIDLPGEARDIRNVEFRYRTLRREENREKAIVHLYGRTR
jgi:hypothetical protein